MAITGERAVTAEGGFNPAWQRHVAEYVLAEPFLGPGRVLDLGCGIGHSFHRLAPRETVGVDLDPEALASQNRQTVVADMRELPFDDESFEGLISAHSIEHVPDGERVIAEAARVLRADGTAIFITPNRLTFGKPDEIIDPYHFVEYDPDQLADLCRTRFRSVEVHGVFGSERYAELDRRQAERLDAVLARDPLRLRRLVPRWAKKRLYDWMLTRERIGDDDPLVKSISIDDFSLRSEGVEHALDLLAVCRSPIAPGGGA